MSYPLDAFAPPARTYRPAREARAIRGHRVVLLAEDRDGASPRYHVYDWRAVSEVVEGVVQVVDEAGWYRWQAQPADDRALVCPHSVPWPADQVWVE